ncbi:unnamed protein product [Aureobasidium uvarum]|uniref:Mid2 domain-containing protein n=1 Tax=Aureobasidium uvarum TaxID=2773716 RepID=A0A9N8KMB1_9PEZI|nr:unnamed protein product [Aureobasidium uvarum]
MLLHFCHATNVTFIRLFLFWLSIATDVLGQITKAPSCSVHADPWHSQGGLLVEKRDIRTFCDSSSKFYCYQPAACVSGSDGYIGCCSAIGTTCVPRTECIDYTSSITATCDYVTGGCVYCSESSLPFCVKAYRHNNYVFSCGTEKLTTTYADTATESSIFAPTGGPATPSAAPTTSQPTETSYFNTHLPSSSVVPKASATSLPSLSTSPSPSMAMKTSTPGPAPSSSLASSRGLIIGIIIGAAAGSIILLALLFVLWKCWKRRRSGAGRTSREKSSKAGYSLGSVEGEDSIAEHTNSRHDVISDLPNSPGPAELGEQSHRSTDDASASTHAHSVANHNLPNAQPYSPEDVRGAAEVPANAPAWSSPSIAISSPAPSNSSLWMTTPGIGTPRAPSSHYAAYTPYTPSSAYSASGQPPSSLPQSRYGGGNTAQESPLAELEAHEIGRAQ